jgi:hypothetical protein
MTRLPRYIKAFGLAVAMFGLPASWAAAQAADPAAPAPVDPAAAPATPAPDAPPAADPTALAADTFIHFLLVGDFKQAAQAAGDLTNAINDMKGVAAVEDVFADRGRELEPTLFVFRDNADLKDPIDALLKKIDGIRTTSVRDPAVIAENITKLATGNLRERDNAMVRLVQAGEVAVPQMVARLRDGTAGDQHPAILLALSRMRGSALAPLIAATQTADDALAAQVIGVLLGLDSVEALPWIVRIAEDPTPARATLRERATRLLFQRGVNLKQVKSAELFYQAAERFYYNSASLRPDPRDNGKARVWLWDEAAGLRAKEVPASVYADVMAMRYAEQAAKGDSTGDAVSLWLAANNKREAQLQAGEDPGMYQEPTAHYWNVRIGSRHLNQVLVRSLRDGSGAGLMVAAQRPVHTQVALRAIKSLSEIVGQNSIEGSALLEALRFPDKVIRYEAALALAGGLPQKSFSGQDRVVLLLAECLAQTGTPGVLILANTPDDVTKLSEGLGKTVRTAGGTNADDVLKQSAKLPSVDVILVADNVNPEELRRFLAVANTNARLDYAARLFLVKDQASPWFQVAITDQRVSASQVTADAADALQAAVTEARKKAGGIELDEAAATQYALRAAAALQKLTISRGQVLNVAPTEPTLIAGLTDARAELAKASAGVLALFDSKETQPALIDRAINDDTQPDVKEAMYKAIAVNAKFFGNRLDAQRVDALRKATDAEKDPNVRVAASEAFGALNLGTEQVKELIIKAGPQPTAAPMNP